MKTDLVANLLVASIIVTLISGIIKYYNVTDRNRSIKLVAHTHEVIQESSDLLSLLLNVEASQRGFIITHDSSDLQHYHLLIPKINEKLKTLEELTTDNPRQTTLINQKLRPLVKSKTDGLTKMLEVYQSKDRAGASANVKDDSGNVSMENLRNLILQFTSHEEELLQERTTRLQTIHTVNDTIHYASFFLICFISGFALVKLLEKDKKNKELLSTLNETNRNLEIKVHERTVELEKKSQQAEKSNRDLKDNFEELKSFYEALHINNAKVEDTLNEIRDLYDNAPCGYHSLAADGLIVRMNQTELGWLGYTRSEVIGKMNVTEILKPSEHESYYQDYAAFIARGYIRNKEHTLIRKDGTSFQILLNATAIYDENGKYVMSRGMVTDITERKAIEQKLLEANQSLIRLNEEKNHFLGIAIHDLKSPLNSILGLINLPKLKGDNLNPEQLEYIRLIQHSCINMQALIFNLLDINKIEQGLNVVHPEDVTLTSLLQHQLEIFNEQALRKNISLILEDNLPGKTIHTDPAMLQRILENLISNAIKFSPYHKEILIRVIYNEAHVTLEVIDQGSGIKAEEMPKLFRKFQKLSSQPTGGENSTGLGLSITKELVIALKGSISVESEVNRGSKFIVELPINL